MEIRALVCTNKIAEHVQQYDNTTTVSSGLKFVLLIQTSVFLFIYVFLPFFFSSPSFAPLSSTERKLKLLVMFNIKLFYLCYVTFNRIFFPSFLILFILTILPF